MLFFISSFVAAASIVAASTSPKRGLCFVPSTDHPDDNSIWDSSTSDLTWYYNYQSTPSSTYQGSDLEFVPMLWGAPSDVEGDMSFYNTVKNLIESGINITHVLGFNEPDAGVNGGSGIPASDAATVWKNQFEPLKQDYGVKLGAPAVTGGESGHVWLQDWFTACAAISNSSCDVDFIPVHWYGNFEGLASHIGQVGATYSNVSSIWVTEFACQNCSLYDAQDFYNTSTTWLDDLSNVTHYSYFGAFRADVSNVGPNAAFLTSKGKLTDIGNWYLGQAKTGAVPNSSAGRLSSFSGWAAIAFMFYALL